jgi:virulence-associated protein VagC
MTETWGSNGPEKVSAGTNNHRLFVSTAVYTPGMMHRAKIFRNGSSQAVRLPKACRFPVGSGSVLVHQEGNRIVMELPDEWPADFIACQGALKEVLSRPQQTQISAIRDPFA